MNPKVDSEVRMMVIVIDYTLHLLERLWISEPLVDEVADLEGAEVVGGKCTGF